MTSGSDQLRASASDEDLMRAWCAGHADAMHTLIHRYHRPLMRYFQRAVGTGGKPARLAGSVAAEDLFQECFLRVMDGAPGFDDQRRFRPWLFQIAHNLCLDTWRRNSASPATGQDDPIEDVAASPEPSPEARAASREWGEALSRAIESLPSDQRSVVLLRDFGGLSYADIATTLDIPLNTVLTRRHRAVKRLRELLAGQFGPARGTAQSAPAHGETEHP